MSGYLETMFGVSGKTALVTGGSSGIGRMIAEGLVRGGATVYISSRKADVCEQVAAELSEFGTCRSMPANLATEDGCRGLAEELTAVEGKLHILVNNAGANWGAPLADHDEAAWSRVLDLNVKGVFHMTRFLEPVLTATGTDDDPARVINIGSVDGIQVPLMDTYAYSTSKAAVHQMSRMLARHLSPKVTVNAIAPGPFQSKMMAATLDAFEESIIDAVPAGRIGRDDDMAGTALFLCSRAGSYVTGSILAVDGGMATTK